MRIILASTSPRRKALLKLAHIDFEVLALAVDETIGVHESAHDYIFRMVADKACAAMGVIDLPMPALILTADTIGVLDEMILTKPESRDDAFAMWRKMSGCVHEVWTAVQASLMQGSKLIWQDSVCECTQVRFVTLTDAMMDYYWQTGEPQDKAGGYAIQGFGATWVAEIHGNYSNVVGLPLPSVMTLIANARAALGASL